MTFRLKVAVTAYDSLEWLPRALESIAAQDDEAFDVCVVDDATPDRRQGEFVREFCAAHGWTAVLNGANQGRVHAQWTAVTALDPDDDDVVVCVDGDDWLPHAGVLRRLRLHYSPCLLVTYGSYQAVPPSATCDPGRPYPQWVVDANAYREHARTAVLYNHPRTMRGRVWRGLDPDVDMRWPDGTWFTVCADTALMLPALELAGGRYKCLPEVLYCYNSANPRSAWRVDPAEIDRTHAYICDLPRKEPLRWC